MKTNLTPQQTKIGVLAVIFILFGVFFLIDGQQWLSLENLQQNRHDLQAYAEQNYLFLFLGCGLLYIAMTALSLPGGAIFSLALGFLFGRWMGTLLIVVSATIGATLLFLLARYLIADWARAKLQENEQAVKIMEAFQTDAYSYLLFLRLVPLFPFWLVNLAPAFTPVSTRTYIIATFLGIIPGSFVFANLGQSLAEIESADQLLSMPVIIAFTLLGLLALAPVLLKRYKAMQAKPETD